MVLHRGANYSGSAAYDGMDIFVVRCATGVTLVKSLLTLPVLNTHSAGY